MSSDLVEVRVGAHAGQSYPEDPRWVEFKGRRGEVSAVDSRWREPDRLGFRVRLNDGRRLLLYYLPVPDRWLAREEESSTA